MRNKTKYWKIVHKETIDWIKRIGPTESFGNAMWNFILDSDGPQKVVTEHSREEAFVFDKIIDSYFAVLIDCLTIGGTLQYPCNISGQG
jgi:hypothetical protein